MWSSEKKYMIRVTRLNRSAIALNSDLIQEIEATPDTVVSLTTGQKITVLETEEEIIERVRAWRRSLLSNDCAAVAESGRSNAPLFGRGSQG
jgi:flagellar protein FlbD